MVFQDLSDYPKPAQEIGYAPVADRLASVLVDVTLFSPFFSLILSGLLRQLQVRYDLAPESVEFSSLLVVTVLCFAGLSIAMMTSCWTLFGATPGQYFFQLRVKDFQNQKQNPEFRAALSRAVVFVLEVALMGIPFLEVFSHRERRVLHDRASETILVSRKQIGMKTPAALEKRVMHSVFTLALAFVCSWIFTSVTVYYKTAVKGSAHERELADSGALCSGVPSRTNTGGRLDAAIALYWVGGLSADCLSSETDLAFWKGSATDQAWASFATALMNDHDKSLRNSYLKQTCEKDGAQGPVCQLSQWWDQHKGNVPEMKDSWTRAVLAIGAYEKSERFQDWQQTLTTQLPEDFDIPEFLETQKIKLLWSQKKIQEARGGYQVISDELSTPTRRDLASDLCFSQMADQCGVQPLPFCHDLEEDLTNAEPAEVRPEWILALAEKKSCDHSPSTVLAQLISNIDTDSDWGRMAMAMVPESGWTENERLQEARSLAFSDETPGVLRSRALLFLFRSTRDEHDFEKGQLILSQTDLSSLNQIRNLFLKSAEKAGFGKTERLPASESEK